MEWHALFDHPLRSLKLLGALLALPLAFVAILVPVLQENRRLKRRFIAARAILPLHLSTAAQYAINSGRAIAACRSVHGVNEARKVAFVPPEIPPALVLGLEQAIESTAKTRVARRLASMIAEIQVLDSRMSTVASETVDGMYLDTMLLDAGTVHALASSLFEFARGEVASTPRRISWNTVGTGLHLMDVREGNYVGLYNMIQRAHERGADPENFGRFNRLIWLRRRWTSIWPEAWTIIGHMSG